MSKLIVVSYNDVPVAASSRNGSKFENIIVCFNIYGVVSLICLFDFSVGSDANVLLNTSH